MCVCVGGGGLLGVWVCLLGVPWNCVGVELGIGQQVGGVEVEWWWWWLLPSCGLAFL